MNLNRWFFLALLMIVSTILGCRSNSSLLRFRLLDSFHSTKAEKSEGLIADQSTSLKTDTGKSAAPANFALVSYREVSRSPSDSTGLIYEAQLPLLLASLQDENTDKSASPSDSPPVTSGNGNKQSEAWKSSEDNSKSTAPPALPSMADSLDNSVSGVASLDLESLEAIAMANNPSVAEQQALVDSLRGRWVQAGLKPNPTLGFSGQQLFSQGQAEQIGIFAGQRIVRSEKLAADQQIVCREMDIALQKLAAQQRRVLTDVRLRYFEVLIAQRRRQVTDELVKIAGESLKKTNSLLEAELGTKIDVLRSTVELQETDLQHVTAQNQLMSAWRQLAAVVGQPDLPLHTVHGNIDPETDLDEDSLTQQLLIESPEIAAMVAQRQRAQAQLHRAMVEPLPDIDIESVVQHDNGINGADANLQVTLPIPFRNRNQGAIAEARMQLAAAQYAQRKIELSLQERLATVWQRYESALAQVKGFKQPEGILNNSRKTLELIRKAYDAGEIGSLELITAQRVYSQTSLQYLVALSEYWSSKIELEGQLLKGSLQN
jgi:outer membrane protein, heavy metal efflux system